MGLPTSIKTLLRRGVVEWARIEHFGVSRSTLDRDVRSLKREGLLRRTGSTSDGAWQVLA